MNALRRLWRTVDDRTGISEIVRPLASHLVPPGTNWWYVFGSATLSAFVIQVVTGIALATVYVPATNSAYQSLEYIGGQAAFGRVLRGMHYFGASAMVLFVGIHMIRVFLTGSYKFPREMNWLSGVLLLALTMLMGFTGQLLRWNQDAVWSVVVGAAQAARVPVVGPALAHGMLGGTTVGGATLTRFYAFHVFFIPAIIFAALGAHLFLVIRNGISELPKAGRLVDPATYRTWYHDMLEREGRPFWPDVIWRDVVFSTGLVICVASLAWFVGPPALGKPPDPTIIQADPRPDWYLLWYFAILAMIPRAAQTYVIVLAPLVVGVLLVSLPFVAHRGERSPLSRPWAIAAVLVAVVMVGTLWREGLKAPWSPAVSVPPLPASVIGATSGAVYDGARLFQTRACIACHTIGTFGGQRGPDLTTVASRLSVGQMTTRILTGAVNMPAYAGSLRSDELSALIAFLSTRTTQGAK